jgi:hypothetical protein
VSAPRYDLGVATRAWAAVQRVAAERADPSDRPQDRYRSRAVQLPAMLRTSGLAAALVYLGSKDVMHRRLADDLMAELRAAVPGLAGGDSVADLVRALGASVVVQRRAERHARLFADWLKRAVETEKLAAAAAVRGG